MIKHQTKDDIAKSFAELVRKKDLSKISVKNICESVGIARQSFYYHFEDISDLIAYCIEAASEDIAKEMMQAATIEEALTYLYQKITKNYDIFRKVFDSPYRVRNQTKIIMVIKDWLMHLISNGTVKVDLRVEELASWLDYQALGILGSFLNLANSKTSEGQTVETIVHILTK